MTISLTGCQNNPPKPQTAQAPQKVTEPSKESLELAAAYLKPYGLKVQSADWYTHPDGSKALTLKATTEASGSETLYHTSGVSTMFLKLVGNLQASAAKNSMNLQKIKLETPLFKVENRGAVAVRTSVNQVSEGPIIYRNLGKLQFDLPLNGFVGAKQIALQWKSVFKVNHVNPDEKKTFCDIIVRQSGVPYCQFQDLLFTLDGQKAYLASGSKLLQLTNFEELRESVSAPKMRVLFCDQATGMALIQSVDDGVLTLANLSTGSTRFLNLYEVERLNELKSAEMIQNDGMNWIVFDGADYQRQPYVVVMPISEHGKTVYYECPNQRLEALKTINENQNIQHNPNNQNNSEKSMKTWIEKGWLIKLPQQIEVERSQ